MDGRVVSYWLGHRAALPGNSRQLCSGFEEQWGVMGHARREPTLMDETDAPEIPQSQFDRAELLLHFLEEAEVSPLDMLDAMASAGLKLVPDTDGECSGEYYGVLKKAIRADKAPLN